MNPFTKMPYNDLINKVVNFPASDPLVLEELRSLYKKNDVLIIKAATGSGKSVVIASEIMKLENLDKHNQVLPVKKVVITEPRSLNTHTADYLNNIYDKNIFGRAYRGENKITDETRLDFVTDGYLLNFFFKGEVNYESVIIDEVHTRNINIDLLMAFSQKFMKEGKIKKLILMSATMDTNFYKDFYSDFKVGVLEIPGVTFPINDIYLSIEENYIGQSIQIIKSLKPIEGNILIFLASSADLKKSCYIIKENCYELHKGTPEEIKDTIIRKEGMKIIFSTNIAESGITMPSLKYVIDSGRSYKKIFNAEEEMYEMRLDFVSKSEILQRRGRVGRTDTGTCYHLYSEKDFNGFSEYQLPEIISDEISSIILKLIVNNNFELIHDVPDVPKHIEFGIKILKNLKLIEEDLKPTQLGIQVNNLGIDPQFAIAIIRGRELGVSRSICMILAMLTVEPELDKWFTDEKPNYTANAVSDIFIFKKIFESFLTKNDSYAWCKKKMYNYNKLLNAKRQFFKLNPGKDTSENIKENIREALVSAFPLNIAQRVNSDMYSIDRPVKTIVVKKPTYLSKLSKKFLYLTITKINNQIKLGNIVNC